MMADPLPLPAQVLPADAEKCALAYLCLGANVGAREQTLKQALELLELAGVEIRSRSSLYETPPWGPIAQGPYLNQVVAVCTTLSPHTLLALALRIERTLGRDRAKEMRYGPRHIDIDILLYDDVHSTDADLELPHPRILERAFVLVPLVEIAPQIIIQGRRADEALAGLDRSGIVRIDTA